MIAEHVTISGRNMDVGDALKEYVQTKVEALGQKYFSRLVSSRIVFSKLPKGHSFNCHIQVVVGSDMHYAGEAQFDDPHRCFNIAYEHVAKQLRRAKRAMHEDKPNGHMKQRVLDELSVPDHEPVEDTE